MENILIVFGGMSVEHEVSIITGMQIIENIDKDKYNPIPLYINKDGKFLTGDALKDFNIFKNNDFSSAFEVYFKPFNNDFNLYTIQNKKNGLFSKKENVEEVYAKIDSVFLALHGTYGEDGCLQGLLELVAIPYTGCGVLASAIGMDKIVMKKILKSEDIPMTDYFDFYRKEWNDEKEKLCNKAKELGYPLFIKPANLGSSIGISKANDEKEFISAVEIATNYDRKILVEKAVENPREINISVLGYENDVVVSECEEPIGWKELLKYEDKYISGTKGSKSSMANKKKRLPAEISEDLKNDIQYYAKKAFTAIDCMGVSRIDFLLKDDKVYLNEINTLPGSIAFYLWEVSGIKFKDLITKLIEMGKLRHDEKLKNIYSYDSDLLKKTSYGAKLK